MLDAGFSTLSYLKSRILPDAGWADTQWDLALSKLGLSVARRFETHCNRHLQRLTAASEIYSARTLTVSLKAYPVITLTSVQLRAADGTLSAVTGYSLDAACGLVDFSSPPGGSSDRLLLTYDGGYWLDPMDGTTTPAGATALPDDLLELWLAEVQLQAEARELFGSVALRKDASKTPPTSGLSADAVDGLRPYRRFSGE
jgi:hypothetical protein